MCVVSMRVCVNELRRCETIDFALDERDVSTTSSVVPTWWHFTSPILVRNFEIVFAASGDIDCCKQRSFVCDSMGK